MKSQSAKWLSVITAIIALIISTVLNILYRNQFYQMGVNYIYNYQTDDQTKVITVIQNIISILGNTFFIVAFLIFIHILVYRKLNTIVYIFYIVVNAYFIAVEKQAYQDPRPFFYDTNIQSLQWTCPRSFGFPSGHSWVSVLLYEPVISDIIGTKGWKKLILISILLTGVLIPISRQYLGSHTSDQVTSGILHSMSALILYKYLIQKHLYQLAIKAMKGISLKTIVIVNTICLLISIAIPFILYSNNINNRPFSAAYLANMNKGCGKNYTQNDLEKEAGTAATIIALVFGLVYGFALVSTQKLKDYFIVKYQNTNINIYRCYMKGHWNFMNSSVNVLKYIVFYIIFGGLFVGVIAYGIPAAFNNFYGTYILQTIGYCLFGIAITCFIPILLVRLETIQFQIQKYDHTVADKNERKTNDFLSLKNDAINLKK